VAIYAGYAVTPLNPEPYAYQSGFAVKQLILRQLAADPALADAPWLARGPHLWADGTTPRADGLTWECDDYNADGTHPNDAGRAKVAQQLLDFVRTDPTAREWYLSVL
jgi:lysophospholipase L1-like esterase